MKFLIKIFMLIVFLISPVYAVTFDVLVLPCDILNDKENYFAFDEASVIFASDIISNFNSTNGKVKSPDLYFVREKLNKNQNLKILAKNALKNYEKSRNIDYDAYKKLSKEFSCNSVVIISSGVVTGKNSLKRSLWEVLDVSSGFDISYPYRLETSVILLDNVNDLIMWSNNYSTKITLNNGSFKVKNYSQAFGVLEKIRMYSVIISSCVSENIVLRLFPKTINPVENNTNKEDNGGALRYERNIPEKPRKNTSEPYYGDMIYGI